ncbi:MULTISPECIES: methyltransferase [unclassified Nonomuraea]|uniref:methyltransferase n=1 Tax=unclassified Nonomuraea TaxID=2593643 RepID=UPI00191C23A6|nr:MULTISPECIES: methyltransferase [unclassified Nonomuraea]
MSLAAVRAARDNAGRNNVVDRVEIRHSDVFSESRPFDLIVFDPPFRWFAAPPVPGRHH